MRCHTGIEKLFCQPSRLLQREGGREGRRGGGRVAPCVADMEPRAGGKITRGPSPQAQALRDACIVLSTLHLFSFDYPFVSEPP
jgi:hypothetical protein